MVSYKNDKFYINDKELFITGGELHYFRLPKDQWEDRIIKIKEAGFNLVSTYIPWLWHEMTEGIIDVTGTTTPERDLKTFVELVRKHGLYLMVRPGPYVMSELRNAGLPDWLMEKYPEVRGRDVNNEFHCVYEMMSYLHPTYIEKVRIWYKAVFEILAPHTTKNGGHIIMAQLDNEIGMFHWVTNQPDLSDNTLSHFDNYLKKDSGYSAKYADYISRDFDGKREFLRQDDTNALMTVYNYFEREYIKAYLQTLVDIAKEYGVDVPVVVNVHGFSQDYYQKRGNLYPIGLSQLFGAMQIENAVTAGDYYIGNIVCDNIQDMYIANVLTKAVQPKGQPLFSAEFQSGFQNFVPKLQPNTHDLNSRICIGQGMKAINYYMFVGGYNYEDMGIISKNHDWQAPISMTGETRLSYKLLSDIKYTLNAYGDIFVDAKVVNDGSLAIDLDYFSMNYNDKKVGEIAKYIQMYREVALFEGYGKVFSHNNINTDGVNLMNVDRICVKEHPNLAALTLKYMSEKSQEKLVNYVKDGGTLLIYPHMPTMNLVGEPCTILKDFIGVEIKEDLKFGQIEVDGISDIPAWCSHSFDIAEGFVHLNDDKNTVMGFEKQIGSGKVVVLGATFECGYDYQHEAMLRVLKRAGIKPSVEVGRIEDNFMVQRLNSGETYFYAVNNLDDYKKELVIKTDGQDMFGGNKIAVNGRQGVLLPVNFNFGGLKIEYATQEVYSISENNNEINVVFSMKTPVLNIKYSGDYTLKNSCDCKEQKIVCHDEFLTLTFSK